MGKIKGKNEWVLAYWGGCFVGAFCAGLAVVWGALTLYIRYVLRPIDSFDGGDLMLVLVCMALAGTVVGVFGAYISGKCAKRNRSYTFRFAIKSYLGWSFGMVFVYLASAACLYAFGDYNGVLVPGVPLSYYPNDSYTRSNVDNLQKTLKCCGYYNYTEWFHVKFSVTARPGELALPDSCCNVPTSTCVREVQRQDISKLTHYEDGCLESACRQYALVLRIMACMLLLVGLGEAGMGVLFFIQMGRIEKPPPEEMELLLWSRTGRDPKQGGDDDRHPDMMDIRHDMASIQSFFDAPKLSTSALWWNKKKEPSQKSLNTTAPKK